MNNSIRKSVVVLIFLLSLFSMGIVTYGEESTKGVTIAKDVNVRKDPDIESSVIGTLSLGESVQILDNEEDWYFIQLSNGSEGWVYNDLVVPLEESKDSIKKGIVIGNNVNVREQPNTQANVMKSLGKDMELKIVGEESGWYQLLLDDQQKGWIHSDFVKTTPNYSTGKINGSNVNVRASASLDSSIVATLGVENYVSIKNFLNGWYHILMDNGQEGWVHQNYMTILMDGKTNINTEVSRSATRLGGTSKIVDFAKKFLGTPYRYGTNGPTSFDCSGFTSYVFKSAGIAISRTSKDQAHDGQKISKSELSAGDLVFFDTTGKVDGKITHVGIYIGDGKFIHASSGKSAKKVVISELNEGYYKDRFITASRLF